MRRQWEVQNRLAAVEEALLEAISEPDTADGGREICLLSLLEQLETLRWVLEQQTGPLH